MWKHQKWVHLVLVLTFVTLFDISGISCQRISVQKCEEYKKLFREEYVDPAFPEIKVYDPIACPIFVGVGFLGLSCFNVSCPDKTGKLTPKCGGVLISEQFILTAAHCFKQKITLGPEVNTFGSSGKNFHLFTAQWEVGPPNKRDGLATIEDCCQVNPPCENPKQVTLGDIKDKSSRPSTTRLDIDITKDQIIKHENYKPPASHDDIALIKLAKPVPLRHGIRSSIRPVCLQQEELPTSAVFQSTGFRLTEAFGASGSDVLQTVTLPVVSSEECSDFYRDALDFNRRFPSTSEPERDSWTLPHKVMCAGGIEDKDTCGGDSGGPLFYSPDKNFPCHRYVAGLTSFGTSFCGSRSPGVYTRVSAYIDWIEKHVWPTGRS